MSLDPIRTTQAITDSYLNYLSTTFRLKDTNLQRQFEKSLQDPGKFVKGPILEATPPFETSATIEELIESGVLSPRFRELNTERLPISRPLYYHQQQAIEKIRRQKRKRSARAKQKILKEKHHRAEIKEFRKKPTS